MQHDLGNEKRRAVGGWHGQAIERLLDDSESIRVVGT